MLSTRIDKYIVSYFNRNWSIFPVYADQRPEFAKHPAVRWAEYQIRVATLSEINRWYHEQNLSGIAIVTGNLSRLLVLDFDSIDVYNTFCNQYPKLAHSYTVNTRRGKHIYYTLIPSLKVPPTMRGNGVDLQAEGAYVVAPPTTINGFTYTIAKDLPLHTLIPAEIALIQRFIQSSKHGTVAKPLTPTSATLTTPDHHITVDHIQRLYLESLTIGRNNALFWVSCLARDYGISQSELTRAMVNLHASRPTPAGHRPETHASRTREAYNTIASAYSRPPRPIKPYQPVTAQVPNHLREIMLQIKMMDALRTIEALRLVGITPHTQFTAQEAIERLRGIVGRDTIRNALNSTAPNTGLPLFQSPRAPLGPNGIAIEPSTAVTNSCELVTVKKSGKNAKGRPAVLYTMPSNDDLFAIFDQKPFKQSDPLTLDDLKNVRRVRMTLHQKFLTRLPGRWSVASFARRLGVTTRTIRNYHNLDEQFRCVPLFKTNVVRWSGLKYIFEGEFPHKGFFLTDSLNKKYPAKEGIAKKLLAKRQDVLIHERIPNFWWYGSADTPPIIAKYQADLTRILNDEHRKKFAHTRFVTEESLAVDENPADTHAVDANPSPVPPVDVTSPILNVSFTPPQHLLACDVATHRTVKNPIATIQPPLLPDMPILAPDGEKKLAPAPKYASSKFDKSNTFRRPFADEAKEELAIYLQKAINTRTTDKSHRITRESARRLVGRYSESAIRNALRLMESRKNITKPVGFISTVLRASARHD